MRSGIELLASGLQFPFDLRKKILHFLGDKFPAEYPVLTHRVAFSLLILGAVLLLGEPSKGASEAFVKTATPATARVQQTATLLPSEDVLVTGGLGVMSSILANAELYSSASGTWTATGSMSSSRANHSATLLPSGKVLVFGGSFFAGQYTMLASAELYDPATGMWALTGSAVTPRYLHTATLLSNGKVLVTGGGNANVLSRVELYDPLQGTWTETGSLATARARHTATLLPNGKVLVAGGAVASGGNGTSASAELFDPLNGTWTETGRLAEARYGHTATLLPHGKRRWLEGMPAAP